MTNKESCIDFITETNQNSAIKVLEVNICDWDGSARPDDNFQNTTIHPKISDKQRAKLNKFANSA